MELASFLYFPLDLLPSLPLAIRKFPDRFLERRNRYITY
jgi:hypothetical protein